MCAITAYLNRLLGLDPNFMFSRTRHHSSLYVSPNGLILGNHTPVNTNIIGLLTDKLYTTGVHYFEFIVHLRTSW